MCTFDSPDTCPQPDPMMSKRERVALGIEIAMHHARLGEPMTPSQIAAFCDVSCEAIRQIEIKALKKLRKNPKIRPLLMDLFGRGMP